MKQPAIRVHELGHIVLYVRDINLSAEFYEKVLGWKRIPTPAHMPIAAFSSGRTHHELLLIEVGDHAAPKPEHLQIGLYHFGLKVGDSDDDLRSALETLEAHGVPITGSGDHHVTHSLYIEDPDGNQLELYIDVPGADWANDPSLITQPVRPLNL